jgi:hypothetical protein
MAGAVVGVFLSNVSPSWITAILMVLVLGFSAYKSIQKGLRMRGRRRKRARRRRRRLRRQRLVRAALASCPMPKRTAEGCIKDCGCTVFGRLVLVYRWLCHAPTRQ